MLIRSLLIAATALLALAPAAAAQTAADVGGGQTMLQIDRGTAKAIQAAGLGVSLLRPARNGKSGATFPVSGGSLDPGDAARLGRASRWPALPRRARRASACATSATRSARAAPRSRRAVGGTRLKILNLDLSRAKVGARGPLTKTASRIRATLTGGAAKALNAAFGTTAFRGGLLLGTVRTEVVLADAVFAGGATRLQLDPAAGQALTDLGITPGRRRRRDGRPRTASRSRSPAAAVDAETLAGEITHSGGISLTRGSTRVELTEFTIGIDDSPALSALVGGQRVEILTLDVSAIETSVRGGTIVVSGVVAHLTAAAAGALNQAFDTTAFKEGLRLGTATVSGDTA